MTANNLEDIEAKITDIQIKSFKDLKIQLTTVLSLIESDILNIFPFFFFFLYVFE